MTLQKARIIFHSHMTAMQKRKLTQYEQRQLDTARAVLRRNKRANPHRRKTRKYGGMASRGNPGKSTRVKDGKKVAHIYSRVLRIEAQKGKPHGNCDIECKKCGHKYFHDFRSAKKIKMIGLHPGQVFRVPRGCWPLLIIG